MLKIENQTPFASDYSIVKDEHGRDLLVFCVKATFGITEQGVLSIQDKQIAVNWQDIYYDEPTNSSLKYASDLMPFVTGTDVILHGCAYPDKPHTTFVHVGLQVAQLQKVVTAFGFRQWASGAGVQMISSPKPFQKIPLQYEYAFGGRDESAHNPKHHGVEARNPIGIGFRTAQSQLPLDGQTLPYIEFSANRVKSATDTPVPAGFGAIAPHWQPRVLFGGTYDAVWQKTRMPLLPTDFDWRFFQVASAGLTSAQPFQGNEPVQIVNATPFHKWKFRLPVLKWTGEVIFKKTAAKPLHLKMGRVLIDAEMMTVTLTWSDSLVVRDIHQIKKIEVKQL